MHIIVNAPDEVLKRVHIGSEIVITDICKNFDGTLVLNVQLIDKIDKLDMNIEII